MEAKELIDGKIHKTALRFKDISCIWVSMISMISMVSIISKLLLRDMSHETASISESPCVFDTCTGFRVWHTVLSTVWVTDPSIIKYGSEFGARAGYN